MSETPARDGMLDFALAAFKDSPNPVVAAHANKLADAFEAEARAAVPSAPAGRAAILREAVERLRQVPFTNVLTDLRRMANEAEYVATPCSFGACEPGGEPCTTHERLMAHAEGDHELCEPDCGTSPSRMADEAQQPETPLHAELKPWQLLGDVPDEPLPQTERLVGGRRLTRDGAQQPASTAPLAANLPLVKGRCPACNGASLFLGDGGYVTCSRIDCPEPDAASTALEKPADEAQQPETQAENPARIDRLRPEFTDHASVESIDAQLQRARSQLRRWHLRVEWLISLRQARLEQKERGEWPAAVPQPAVARQADTAGEQQ